MIQRLVGVRSVDGAYWSLSVELIFYAAIFVVLLVRRAELVNRAKTLAVLWLGLSLVVAVVSQLHPGGITDALVVLTAAQYAPLFVVGMLLLLCRSSRLDPLVWVAVATAIAVSWLIVGTEDSLWVLCISLVFIAVIRAGSDCMAGHVLGHDRAGTNGGTIADSHPAQHYGTLPDENSVADDDGSGAGRLGPIASDVIR